MTENFTVAICTRDRADALNNCLTALLETLPDISTPIIVVDNASTDATSRVAERFGSRIQYFFEPRVGLSHARNRALSHCETKYLVFLDDDGVPDREWGPAVEEIVRVGAADVFGGPYTPFYTSERPPWFKDEFGSAHLDLVDGVQPPTTCFSGGNMGWRTELLLEAGGFDPRLGIEGGRLRLGEETALQVQFRKKRPNYMAIFSRRMSMTHHVSVSKMSLRYIAKRNFSYGWQLPEIDPENDLIRTGVIQFVLKTKLGLPLVWRAFFRRGLRDELWRTYAARYLMLNGILLGVCMRRALSPQRKIV